MDKSARTDLFSDGWRTHVQYGTSLQRYIAYGAQYSHRDCFHELFNYITTPTHQICALSGLRRTGKTILLYQLLAELDLNKTAYMQVSKDNDMSDIDFDLSQLLDRSFTTVLIDEITYAKDFATSSNYLADYYVMNGMKVVAAGTDSLGFVLANRRTLYDRIQFVNTTFIPYPEHRRLLGASIDEYVQLGGTLLPEGVIPFQNVADSTAYMNSSIVDNIQHALQVLDDDPDYYTYLKEYYYANTLTGLINRVLDDTKHRFVERILNKKFNASNYGALAHKSRTLRKRGDKSYENLAVFLAQNSSEVLEEYKASLCIKDMRYHQAAINELKGYLFQLDVIAEYDVLNEEFVLSKQCIFTQPGMQYSQAVTLVDICKNLPAFTALSLDNQRLLEDFLKQNMLGKIFEDIIINHTQRYLDHSRYYVCQFSFSCGEIDMVIVDMNKRQTSLFEIKHSNKCVAEQTRHLCNQDINDKLASHFYPISKHCVIYNGVPQTLFVDPRTLEFCEPSDTSIEIHYINAESYLAALK